MLWSVLFFYESFLKDKVLTCTLQHLVLHNLSCELSVLVFCSSVGMAKSHEMCRAQSLTIDSKLADCLLTARAKMLQSKANLKRHFVFSSKEGLILYTQSLQQGTVPFYLICELIGTFVGNLYLHTKCGKSVTVNLAHDIHILAN